MAGLLCGCYQKCPDQMALRGQRSGTRQGRGRFLVRPRQLKSVRVSPRHSSRFCRINNLLNPGHTWQWLFESCNDS